MEYLWAFYALTSAFFIALMLSVSEYYKQSGIGFLIVLRSFTGLTLVPFAFFVEWPKEQLFYLYTGVAYLLFPIADILIFRVSAQQGAGVLSRFIPLTAIITFFIWLVVDPQTWQNYMTQPWYALGIVGCLCGIVFVFHHYVVVRSV